MTEREKNLFEFAAKAVVRDGRLMFRVDKRLLKVFNIVLDKHYFGNANLWFLSKAEIYLRKWGVSLFGISIISERPKTVQMSEIHPDYLDKKDDTFNYKVNAEMITRLKSFCKKDMLLRDEATWARVELVNTCIEHNLDMSKKPE